MSIRDGISGGIGLFSTAHTVAVSNKDTKQDKADLFRNTVAGLHGAMPGPISWVGKLNTAFNGIQAFRSGDNAGAAQNALSFAGSFSLPLSIVSLSVDVAAATERNNPGAWKNYNQSGEMQFVLNSLHH